MCSMKIENNQVQRDEIGLLSEILNLKMTLRDLYAQKGPISSDYITLSIKLDLLTKQYIDEKLMDIFSFSGDPR
jgi:hypothetical protein